MFKQNKRISMEMYQWDIMLIELIGEDIFIALCLIYMFNFYFWSPSLARKMRKTNMRYYPEYPSRSWHPILAP
jgi:hypothetical protein